MKTQQHTLLGQYNRRLQWILASGLLVSLYLLILHFRYDVLGATCNIGSLFSCSVLQIKEYSLWFGIPVPVFSMVFYATALGMAFFNRKELKLTPFLYLFSMSVLALLSTVVMAYIAFGVLGTICLFCSLLYIVSIVFFWTMVQVFRIEGEPWGYYWKKEMARFYQNTTTVKTLCIWLVVFAGAYILLGDQTLSLSKQLTSYQSQGRVLGNPNANTRIEIFSDFQCPACKSASPFLYQLEQAFGADVAVQYRFYPLDPSCNAMVRRNMHPHACTAAKAAYCASLQHKFWRFHDRLYDHQRALGQKKYMELARAEKLNMKEFLDCYQYEKTIEFIKQDIALGNTYNVDATPSIFINGKKYTGRRTIEDFRKELNLPSP